MDKLFGIPIEQLMTGLLVIFGIGVVVTAVIALSNPILFKTAVRNIPRRRTQTALIVFGLMLATVLFSAALVTGDTLAHSYRVMGVSSLGEVDVQINGKVDEVTGQLVHFEAEAIDEVRTALAGVDEVAGVAPLIQENAAVVFAPETKQSEPRVDILGIDQAEMAGFGAITAVSDDTLSVDSLGAAEVFISQDLADALVVDVGDDVQVFLSTSPTSLEVAGIYSDGPKPAGDLAMTMPMADLQKLTGHEGEINSIIITNEGDAIAGAAHTDVVLDALEPALESTELTAVPVKQQALDSADVQGSSMAQTFLLVGYFSFSAGILLIFLIFIMLAAERKQELGIARAVGTQRSQVIRMFSFEGSIYSLIAAAIGSLLGVGAGALMVRLVAVAFNDLGDQEIIFSASWRSLVIAFTLGMATTFAVVLPSAWRASRLNIVRAIRDIPEPKLSRKSLKGWIFTILLPIIGFLVAKSGLDNDLVAAYNLGTSLIIIGIPLLAWRLGAHERLSYTLAGVGLLYWWLDFPLPSFIEEISADLAGSVGLDMFFLSAVMLMLGAVWTVTYNADLLVNGLVLLFGRIKGLATILKTAAAYSMSNRFRTGMVLAMFVIIVYALVIWAFILVAIDNSLTDVEQLSGGFDVMVQTGYANPISDMETAIAAAPELNPNDYEVVAGISGMPVQLSQEGAAESEPVDFFISGLDDAYLTHVTYDFISMAAGYETDADVWQALAEGQDVAVVDSLLVPQRTGAFGSAPEMPFQVDGVFLEDEVIPEIYVSVTSPFTGQTRPLQVIGIVDSNALYKGGGLIISSQEVLNSLAPVPLPATTYLLRLREGVDVPTAARAVEAAFVENSVETTVIAEQIRQRARGNSNILYLFEGYMMLGLVVGIAALGVIAARSVVERRHQIGVLRAIGFQRSTVQFSFMLESSLVAVLGIVVGILLGMRTAQQVIEGFSVMVPGLAYDIPGTNIITVSLIALVASLLITFLAARQAAKVLPAEALRYVE